MLCMIGRTDLLLYVLRYIRSRSYHVPGMVFWHHTAVNKVSTRYGLLAVWHATRMHSFSFVLEVRGPTKYRRKREYFGTSTAVPYVVYGTVRTRMIPTTGTYYGSSYRMISAAFHGHTLTGMRVQVLQNEDSSRSRLKGSAILRIPQVLQIYWMFALLLLWILLMLGALCCWSHWYTSMSRYKGTVCLSKRTYRYSHEARMNVLSMEQYHTTYCTPGWSPSCAQTKRSLAAPLRHRRLLLTVSCTLLMIAPLLRRGLSVWRFTAVCQAYYTILIAFAYHY